jgi:hypothetical protein
MLMSLASTFYGGDDSSWAPPSDTHTYFRNFQMWGGSAPSNLTGAHVSAGVPSRGGVGAAWPLAASALAVLAASWL